MSNIALRIAILWNDAVISEKQVPVSQNVTIGAEKGHTFHVPTLNSRYEGSTLFSPNGGNAVTLSAFSNDGWLEQDGKRVDLSNQSVTLRLDDRGLIKLDAQTAIFFKVVQTTEFAASSSFFGKMENVFMSSLLLALSLHLGILILGLAARTFEAEFIDVELDDRFTEILTEKIEEAKKEELPVEEEQEDVGKKAGGEEGKFGQEDKTEKSKVPTTDGEMVDKIKNVGLAKALSSSLMGRGALSSVFGKSNGFSDQLNAAMSGGDGELVIGHGAGGMGLRGTGSGGGGSGFGRIHGMGNIDTGGGTGTKASLGGKGKAKAKVSVSKGAPTVGNFCKQADILRVVNARQSGIQYCYEKELARNPELNGKVTIKWRIALDGKVMKVWLDSSTLKNGTVESCMIRSIERWTFTKPDGGICEIAFPFVFNAGL